MLDNRSIEGLPPGVRIKSIRLGDKSAKEGAYFLASAHLEPDNVYGVLDLAAVPIPEGYERAGEKPEEWFREPNAGESWINVYGTICGPGYPDCVSPNSGGHLNHRRIILRRKTSRVLVCEFHNPKGLPENPSESQVSLWLDGWIPDRWRIEEQPERKGDADALSDVILPPVDREWPGGITQYRAACQVALRGRLRDAR